jgi:hypothetical protein
MGPESPWRKTGRMDIGRALLAAHPKALTAPEIAARGGGKDSSNIKKLIEPLLTTAGLVEVSAPASGQPRKPGRPAACAYTLTTAGLADLRAVVATSSTRGALEVGHQLVFADAAAVYLDGLNAVLSDAEHIGQAAWAALVDGDPQQYVIAYVGPEALDRAIDLAVVLSSHGIPVRRAAVAQVTSTEVTIEQSNQRLRLATRARMQAATRQAAI